MKRMIVAVLLSSIALWQAVSQQYPLVSIRQIQEISIDSLLLADTLQRTANSRWTLQRSPYYQDTVSVVGVVVVQEKVITYTATGFTLLLADTGSTDSWGGLFVRFAGDSAANYQWKGIGLEAGDLVKITGWVDEYPSSDMVSSAQLVPIASIPVELLGSAPIPQPAHKTVGDFYSGVYPGGSIRFSTGEPYEGMRVEFTNLTVVANTGLPYAGQFTVADQGNNMLTVMDASKWFTLRTFKDPSSTYLTPPVGATIDTLRGWIMSNSGQNAPRGYLIAPIFPGDITYGIPLPLVTTHRRNPIVVPPDSSASVSVKVTQQVGGGGIASVNLRYSVDSSSWTTVTMTRADTVYRGTIPQQSADTFVRYYVQAVDSLGRAVKVASSAIDGSASDTLKGFFFYRVINRPMTIHDVQYTPYTNGRTPYLGAVTTVGGIVTADTAHFGLSPLNNAGTNAWYIQSGNQPWGGLWVTSVDSTAVSQLKALVVGDSVLVTGTVQEEFEVTRLGNVTGVVRVSGGNPLPPPVTATTGVFNLGVGNGTPAAEQYEDMLVTFNNVVVTDLAPTYSDNTEYAVNDGSGTMIVRRDGLNSYSNLVADTASGKKILKLGDQMSYLTGVMHFSFGKYKLEPRTDTDFGTITSGIERIDDGALPSGFVVNQNFPNPFNPSTAIRYSIPSAGLVDLRVYNLLGQEVRRLVHEVQTPGTYVVRFDATSLPSGVYLYRVQLGGLSLAKKMVLLK